MAGRSIGGCGHHYREHMHLTYYLVKESKRFISDSVKKLFDEAKSKAEGDAILIRHYEITIEELKEEEEVVKKVAAYYAVFLSTFAILPYNDAMGQYLETSIKEEESKGSRVMEDDKF